MIVRVGTKVDAFVSVGLGAYLTGKDILLVDMTDQINPRDITRHRLNCDGIIVHSLSGGGDQHTPIVLSFTNPSHPSDFFLLFINRRFLCGNL